MPDAAFAPRIANRAEPFLFRQRFRKAALDQPPAHREIVVVRRQGPDRMKMIGQDDNCVDRKAMARARDRHRLTQGRDVVDEQGLPPLQEVDREEPAPARNERATIIRHEAQDSRSCAGVN